MQSFLTNLADRLVLCPSTDPIDPEDRRRVLIPFADGHLEAWSVEIHQEVEVPQLITIKFPGTAGRAERAGPHPCELWPDVASKIWTINPAGYGGSEGTATLTSMASQCDAIFAFVKRELPNHQILLTGNSLGCVSVLYLAARNDVAGIVLRNPPPLKQLIAGRPKYNWWNFGLARFVADKIPGELDAVSNSIQCQCPAFFLRSEKDRIVPAKYQKLIIDAFGGESQEFLIPGADHADLVSEEDQERYIQAMKNFRDRCIVP